MSTSGSQLLSALTPDFSGKSSAMECLRSKAMPAPEVKRALDGDGGSLECQKKNQKNPHLHSLDQANLHIATSEISLALLDLKKAGLAAYDATSSDGDGKATVVGPSMQYFATIAKACHFAQFLYEYLDRIDHHSKNNKEDKDNNISSGGEENQSPPQQDNGDATDLATAPEEPLALDDVEVAKIIKRIAFSTSGVLAAILSARTEAMATKEYATNEEDEEAYFTADATKSFDSRQVAVYGYGMILKLQHYVAERPSLLPAVWKSLEEIAAHLLHNHPLPANLWSLACHHLAEMILDGVDSLLPYAYPDDRDDKTTTSHPEQKSTQSAHNLQMHLQNQSKILMFVLARFATFGKIPGSADRLFRVKFLRSLVCRLTLLLGMCILEERNATKIRNRDLRNMLVKLSGKAQLVVGTLLNVAAPTDNDIDNDGGDDGDDHPLSNCFTLCRTVLWCEKEIDSSSLEQNDESSFDMTTAMITGKLFVQYQLLDAGP